MTPARPATGTGTNHEAVRRHNLGTLLRHVHLGGEVSRAHLTTRMQLNRSTIGGLVTELEGLGLARQTQPSPSRGAGRPSAGVTTAHDGPFVIAVDLGVDRVVVARVALGGAVEQRARAAIPSSAREAWQVGSTVADLVREVVSGAPPAAPLVGMGVSVPGLVRRSDGLVRLAPNLEWHDVSFGSIVLAALGLDVPVTTANDADLGALAEQRRGAGLGIDDLVYISGNVGVGAGVILGGHPLRGAAGYVGEVGHLRLGTEGRACHCGNVGCWETEVGGLAIAEAVGCPAQQVASLDGFLDTYTGPLEGLREIGEQLGGGLASLVNVFNPERLVLGGYFRPLFALVGDEVRRALAARALPAPMESVSLTTPGLGADSVLVGAAEVALEPLLVDPVATMAQAVRDVPARLAG
ncbi:ROK family protein [Nocardioides marinus]|uniref:Putative NBD/HSP70 family sugar kinase n=1 Tax=Nocardioides marinus TaxID=374514 RepID=A0A7Y9YBI2_9ACTN|nr:putative NBD/HSP70 family sugar kinase [Nocardioides marinus]